jgi:8-oxo-dGTP pyrophosphatase MutT (NUDIX family)
VSERFELSGSEVGWTGRVIRVGVECYRYPDGDEVRRDKVWHPGAVGILALNDETVWLTRQPREVVGELASLEIPAGKLDVPGEPPEETARRELAEEIGKQAASWELLFAFYTSPGHSDELVRLYLATGLSDLPPWAVAEPDEDERIEVVPWPRDRLDDAIAKCEDSKSLIALLWLAARSASSLA